MGDEIRLGADGWTAEKFFTKYGYLECSNWGVYKEGEVFYTDCYCCPRVPFESLNDALDSLVVYPDDLQYIRSLWFALSSICEDCIDE